MREIVERGRLKARAAPNVEAGMMPWTDHRMAFQQTLIQVRAVVRTIAAYRVILAAYAGHEYGFTFQFDAHHLAIFKVAIRFPDSMLRHLRPRFQNGILC